MVLQIRELPCLDLVDGDGVIEIEISALEAAEFEHMCAAAEPTSEIRADGTNVSAFRAMDGEIDVRQGDACDVE